MTALTLTTPDRLSHSSLSTYTECGERWRLERLYKVPSESWYATVAGTAVHEITELIDLQEIGLHDGPIPEFKEVLDREIAAAEEEGTLLRVSGKKLLKPSLAGGPNKKDYNWWLEFGPQMIEGWINWKAEMDWTLATMPDGTPGIEIDLEQEMAGRPFKGFIDRLYITGMGDLVIVDLKSGNLPSNNLQLGTYRVGLMRQHGLVADWGAYWMGTTGQLTQLKDLTRYSEGYIDHLYEMAWRGIGTGVFLPSLSSGCVTCGVRKFCRPFGGEESHRVEPFEVAFYGIDRKEQADALFGSSV